MKPAAFFLVALTSLAAGPARAQDLESAVRRIVEEERTRAGTPAMTVVALRDGDVVAAVASGRADVEAGRDATLDTPFSAASVSKLLTAVLVMRQVERGTLDLDAPANSYVEPRLWIRDAVGEPVPATLRQLLSHHAGLPVSWGAMAERGDRVPSLEEHLAVGLRTIQPPGRSLIYANDGFALAGFIAARAEGEDFEAHAERVLLRPLGMTRSTFRSAWHVPDLAAGYGAMFGGKGRTETLDTTETAPAGSLVTTAPDLGRFASMLLGAGALEGVRIVAPESVREMMRLEARAHPELEEGFGVGFGVRERPGRKQAWWDGSLPGVASRLALLPERGVGVVVLSNLADNEPSAVVGRRILELLAPPGPEPVYTPALDELAALAGSYRPLDLVDPSMWFLGFAIAFRFEPLGDSLVMTSPLSGRNPLTPIGPGRFRLHGSMLDDATILFRGDVVYLGFVRAERISGWQTPAALLAYAGTILLALLALAVFFLARWIRRRARASSAA